MLVSAKEMLTKAKAGKYAVGQSTSTIWSGQVCPDGREEEEPRDPGRFRGCW